MRPDAPVAWHQPVRLARLVVRMGGDAAGNRQPLEAPWNYQGMGNNVVQRIPVTVR